MALATVNVTINGVEKEAVSVIAETDVILVDSVTKSDLDILEAVQNSEPVQEDGETPIENPTMEQKMEQFVAPNGQLASVLYANAIINVEDVNAAYVKASRGRNTPGEIAQIKQDIVDLDQRVRNLEGDG